MKRFLRGLGLVLGGIVAVAVVTAIYVYIASEHEVRRQYEIPITAFAAPSDAQAVVRGKRLATIAGCYASCHGKRMEGSLLFNEPGVARINAPNLTRVLREYSDAELVRLLRHGVKRDGESVWIMPSTMFTHLSDQDLGDLIAFVRSEPEQEGPMRDVTLLPLGRVGVVLGQFKPLAAQIDHAAVPPAQTDRSDALRYGKYLVDIACTECHGQDLRGSDFVHAPNLLIAQAYAEPDFFKLMRTGVGLGERHLGLMSEVGASRFPAFTDDEVRAIRAYLDVYARETLVAKTAGERHNAG